jgi:hypothetical protein
MALAVGEPWELMSAAEAEMRAPRLTERPAAIVALEIDELLRSVASVLNGHDLARTRGATAVAWCDSWELMTSPLRPE